MNILFFTGETHFNSGKSVFKGHELKLFYLKQLLPGYYKFNTFFCLLRNRFWKK